ncbi:MAG: aspartate aminotransferase family protein [Gammaproteobacteria bacterium]|nr:aspartate aminotransferase family protein [Gammaproteobacteria bacterium]
MPDNRNLRSLLKDAAERGVQYREASLERHVAPRPEAVAATAEFVEPMPDAGTSDAEVLRILDEIGSPATVNMVGPRYFGFVIGGSLPVTVASNWLTAAWDQNVGMHEVTPATATLERVAMSWMLDMFGLPGDSAAAFVTGATVANFTALAAARNRVFNDAGWNVEADGLIGAPALTVIVSAETHPTVFKSLGMLGFGRNRVLRAPVDGQGRIDIARFPEFDGPTIICTQAGNVNTGAFDPVGEICALAKPKGAWVHVDGAFGLWAAASRELEHLCSDFAAADSWATDAHKWLNVPYDSGIAFVRDTAALKSAMSITAEYLMTDSEFRNPSDFTPELSRRARGVDVWAALKSLGRDGVANMIDTCCANARRFATGLEGAGYEVLNDVVLNQVLVSFGDDASNRQIIDAIQADGTCWCGVTVWQGKTAMRISVCNWSTTAADVDLSLEATIRIARQNALRS